MPGVRGMGIGKGDSNPSKAKEKAAEQRRKMAQLAKARKAKKRGH